MTETSASRSNPDAVRVPLHFAGSGNSREKLKKLETEFAGLFATKQLFVRLQGSEYFISASPKDVMLFPQTDPLSGRSRYLWIDRGDGVQFGTANYT